MNTLNSVNSVNSVNKPNKTPARAINFVGNKNKTEDRKTVEVAEALPALLLTLLPQSLLRACCCCLFLISTHTRTHTHERQRRQRVWHRQRQPSEANPAKLCMQLQVGVAVCV